MRYECELLNASAVTARALLSNVSCAHFPRLLFKTPNPQSFPMGCIDPIFAVSNELRSHARVPLESSLMKWNEGVVDKKSGCRWTSIETVRGVLIHARI